MWVIVGSWTAVGIYDLIVSANSVFKIPGRVTLFQCAIRMLMEILTWSRTLKSFFFTSCAKCLRFGITTKLVLVIISARSSVRVNYRFITTNGRSELPRRASLSHNTICSLMQILTRTRPHLNSVLTSSPELLCSRIRAKFVSIIICAWSALLIITSLESSLIILPLKSWISNLSQRIGVFMVIIAWTRSHRYIDLLSNAKGEVFWVFTKLVIAFVLAWAQVCRLSSGWQVSLGLNGPLGRSG